MRTEADNWRDFRSQLVAAHDLIVKANEQRPHGESHELNLIEDALALEISKAARECDLAREAA